MSGCSVEEANRLLQTCQNSIKIHSKKKGSASEKKTINEEESQFNYTVELRPNKERLGLLIGEDMRVVGMQKNGLCWRFVFVYCAFSNINIKLRTGSICIGDRIVSMNGKQVDQSCSEIQQHLNEHTDGTLMLSMSRRLQIAPRLNQNALQISNNSVARQNSMTDMQRAATPSNRLNLIDIQKVIGAMAISIQNKEYVSLLLL